MHCSNALKALFAAMVLGALAFVPTGCSNDSGSAPDLGLQSGIPDGYPPAMPSGLEAIKWTHSGLKFVWNANTEGDLAGYRLYVYDPSPFRTDSYCCVHGFDLITNTHYLYQEELDVGMNYFKLAAVDEDGNESEFFGPYAYGFDGGTTDPMPRDCPGGTAEGAGTLPEQAPEEGVWHPYPEGAEEDDGSWNSEF
jgi:hypothetical protein